ncbi:phage tail protein [Bartonella bacilliformis]|uniref:phage tail protein n=1 Tax=Bartonella bacilliformis TaxID=774 RepID=UPI0039E58069
MSSIYDWSLQAPKNANADEIINWAEGQPPSSVNDSARAMMQRIREYLSDHGGSIETDFTVNETDNHTSIKLVTKSPLTVYHDDIVVRFKAQESNIGATSVILNQLSAQPVYKITGNGVKPLSGGEIQKGGLYELVYHCGLAGKDCDGWYLTNPTIIFPELFPSGFIATFAMETLPAGWLVCDGKEYQRDAYPALFTAIGEVWGKGDGKTTFNVPDFRGMFLRGLDSGREIDKDRLFASQQDESFKAHTHEGTANAAGEHQHIYQQLMRTTSGSTTSVNLRYFAPFKDVWTSPAGIHTHTLTLKETGGEETRPVNVAVIYAIKT